MSNGDQQMSNASQPPKGMVANALALFQGKSESESPPGISASDLSSAEQDALVEAKKRKSAFGDKVGSGASSTSGSVVGTAGLTKRDIMSLLSEQQKEATHANKILLSEALEQTTTRNTKLLAAFGEGIQEQLGQVNSRVTNVENDTSELKTEVKQMRELVSPNRTKTPSRCPSSGQQGRTYKGGIGLGQF